MTLKKILQKSYIRLYLQSVHAAESLRYITLPHVWNLVAIPSRRFGTWYYVLPQVWNLREDNFNDCVTNR